jgi:predicted outer membrane repeat protein
VVSSSGVTETAVLDGLTITGGNANGGVIPHGDGGGTYNNGSSPTLTNVTFSGNRTVGHGGGIYNLDGSSPKLTNCRFVNNVADRDEYLDGDGGGMYNEVNSSPVLSGTHFYRNTASNGGGMHNGNWSDPKLTNLSWLDETTAIVAVLRLLGQSQACQLAVSRQIRTK